MLLFTFQEGKIVRMTASFLQNTQILFFVCLFTLHFCIAYTFDASSYDPFDQPLLAALGQV